MNALLRWSQENQVLAAILVAIVWPILTGIATTISRKRTAEEYAAMPPRCAAILRFIAAIGLDVPKMLETVRLIFTGGVPTSTVKKKKDDPPAS